MKTFRGKLKRRLENAISLLIPNAEGDELAPIDEIEVYGRTDENGFVYKGFIVTPGGVLEFGAGAAKGITKTEFKRLLRRSGLPKISFKTLIRSWCDHGLWDDRILEKQLVSVWLPRLASY